MISSEEADKIKEEFRREFLDNIDYLVLSVKTPEKTETNHIEDYYLSLSLYKNSPTEKIPEVYQGMRVSSTVITDISFA